MNSTSKEPLLSLSQVSKTFGSVEVLHNVDLDIFAGETLALLGENGAGKSTLSNIISGSIQPSSGEMLLNNIEFAPATPRAAIESGVGMIHQELRLLPQLTIAENVFVGRYPKKNGYVHRKTMEERAHASLQRLGLDISSKRLVEGLSTANQQLIEIAKALTLNAKLLILDEPTAALGSEETELLFQQINRLKSEGVGIIYISHRLEEIRQIADRIVVLRDGSKVKEFDSGNTPVREIVESMVGRSLDRLFPEIPRPDDEIVLQVENLSSPDGTFSNINFSVKKGEIFGIAGLIGAGRTELVRAITGADAISGGTVHLENKNVTPRTPKDAISNGIILVPEDRKLQGLVVSHNIAENIGYGNIRKIAKFGLVSTKKIIEFAKKNISRFGINGVPQQLVDKLSGGNQQKTVLAKWLAHNPKVVVLDEPTRGIDVGARWSIYEIIVDLAKQGISIIIISSDLEEVLGVSNRIMVMAQGQQKKILDQEHANMVSVMELATN